MIILTDCLSEKVDEGCIKVANTLSKKIKAFHKDAVLVAYNKGSDIADINLELNPLFLNKSIYEVLKKEDSQVLYIPFASNTLASVLRTFVLSVMNKGRVKVLFTLRHPMNAFSKLMLKLSKATVVALSEESYSFYSSVVSKSVVYLRTGVDTERFAPVDNDRKVELRKKYSLPLDKTIVLHIGHLNCGRNVDKLLNLDERNHAVLVLSSVTKNERDLQLYEKLKASDRITVIDEYIKNVEEIYQLSDVYMFPVCEQGKCIDVPLSVLEAAACDKPVVCTAYGELKSFINKNGFYFTDNFDYEYINQLVRQAVDCNSSPREAVLEYDWSNSIDKLLNLKD
ncbi:MAG: glycosyltransferase [Ruminococcus sp.]|nr:glycosyltransferase [Ruminococcus sp.]